MFTTGQSRTRILQALLVMVAVFALLGADQDARFKDLGHRLMCTCGCGQILLECNHVGCQSSDKMRRELAALLGISDDNGGGGASGGRTADSDDLILQDFVQNYGPTVIAAPTNTGFNRVAWVMPYVALLFGIAVVVVVVRAWKNRPAPALADGIQPPPPAELDRFRAQARRETDL